MASLSVELEIILFILCFGLFVGVLAVHPKSRQKEDNAECTCTIEETLINPVARGRFPWFSRQSKSQRSA